MSGPFFRDDDAAVRLPLRKVLGQRLRRRARQHVTVQIEPSIMTRTPNDRLSRLKCDSATFMGAFCAKGMQFIAGLQNHYPLTAYRHDDELVLFKF